ncbi:MAG: nucleotide exchange factor GrpE [Alicyclobacillus herbarius]|nr:nucleotide exchange factor GrpE [Alicyclobacillus herbarius]
MEQEQATRSAESEQESAAVDGEIADAKFDTKAPDEVDAAEVEGEGTQAEGESPVQQELAELREKVQELQNQLLRSRADFENYRRRTRQEMEDLRSFATRQLLADLLPVVDNFDRALGAMEGHAEVREGVEMVQRQLLSLLEKYGVEPMETLGHTFDPKLHEAVLQEPAGDREPGIVAEELQKGYLLHGRVLRPAMVKVTV